MNRRSVVAALACGLLASGLLASTAAADLTREQKKQVSDLNRALRPARSYARKKMYDELKAAIADAEQKISEWEIAEDEKDRSFRTLLKTLETLRASVPVSFEQEVAPILKERCLNCHGETRASGQLRMHTWANMAQGGQSGPLAQPRNPLRSLIIARLVATNPNQRMPRNGTPLDQEQIQLIARWIDQGATFDGADPTATIGAPPPVTVARPDGSETVSFKKDLAPWLVSVCLNCHSGNNPRNGFSLATFEDMLRGGESGSAIEPGDSDASYLIDLVLRQDPLKMPAGNQTRIKRSQAMALAKWVDEGAKYDGGDPRTPLRDLVPSAAELAAAELMNMTDAEFTERRLKQGQDLWERVLPRDELRHVKGENVYVLGAAEEARLEQVADWAEADIAQLKSWFQLNTEVPWRGRLNIFLARDRFGYEEFNQVVFSRQTPKEMTGHAVVTANFDQAYIVVQDLGDEVTDTSPGVRTNLTKQLAAAFMNRTGSNMPRVLTNGMGLMLAAKNSEGGDPYLKRLPGGLAAALGEVSTPQSVFDDGTFNPGQLDSVGLALVNYMVGSGSQRRFAQFVQRVQDGATLAEAAQQVYRTDLRGLGLAFGNSLR